MFNKEANGESVMRKLEGKVAVITGGSSGLGVATAERFVAEGAYVSSQAAARQRWMQQLA